MYSSFSQPNNRELKSNKLQPIMSLDLQSPMNYEFNVEIQFYAMEHDPNV